MSDRPNRVLGESVAHHAMQVALKPAIDRVDLTPTA
jgi:hypothetical protein